LTAGGRALAVAAVVLLMAAVGVGIAMYRVARGAPPGGLPLWLPFVVAAAIAVLGVSCAFLLRKHRVLLMDGRAAPAIVTSHKKVHTTHGGTHRSMTYTFPLLSGASATGTSPTSSKPPGIGTVICVLYDPERPRRSMPYPLPLVRIARLARV
jgi:hypothetical protein